MGWHGLAPLPILALGGWTTFCCPCFLFVLCCRLGTGCETQPQTSLFNTQVLCKRHLFREVCPAPGRQVSLPPPRNSLSLLNLPYNTPASILCAQGSCVHLILCLVPGPHAARIAAPPCHCQTNPPQPSLAVLHTTWSEKLPQATSPGGGVVSFFLPLGPQNLAYLSGQALVFHLLSPREL